MILKEVFDFIHFINKARDIQRNVKIKGRDYFENNAEHSYQLAMIAWYIADRKHTNFDRELILKYALMHDLVEVYAGDTDAHRASKEDLETQREREKIAVGKIKEKFSDFESLHKVIENYENLVDDESKFVYVLDKILPVINTFIAEDKYYYNSGVTFKKYTEWLKKKIGSIQLNEISLEDLISELIIFLKNNSKGFLAD